MTARHAAPRPLSAREVQIVQHLAEGLTYSQIGHVVHLSEHTVKDHVYRARQAIGARNKAHLVAMAIRAGLLSGAES